MAEIFDLDQQPQSSNDRWPENGLRFDGINNSARDLESIIARNNVDTRGGLTLTGGPATYSLNAARSLAGTSLFTGLRISAFVNVTNSNAPTLNVSGKGARNIRLSTGVAARSDDMIVGTVADFVFNATDDSWILLNPANVHPDAGKIELEGNQPFYEGSSTKNTAFDPMMIIRALGRNSAAEEIEYNRLDFQASDVADGAEDGRFLVRQMQGGTLTPGFDMRSANKLALFDESPGAANSLAVPSDFSLIRGGTAVSFGELLKVTRVNSGTHVFDSNTDHCLIQAHGGGAGGSARDGSGNVLTAGQDGGDTIVSGTGISITAGGGANGGDQLTAPTISQNGSTAVSGASVDSSFIEIANGPPGGQAARLARDGYSGDSVTALCRSLPASVSVTQGSGGAGGVSTFNGAPGVDGYAVFWEYR